MNETPLNLLVHCLRHAWCCVAIAVLVTLPVAGCTCNSTDTTGPAGANSPREIMGKVLAAYRSADAYSDRGALLLTEKYQSGEIERPAIPFSIVLQRPNRLQLIAGLPPNHDAAIVGESIVVSDGERVRISTLAQEELREIPSPESLATSLVQKAIDDSVIGRGKLPIARIQLLLGSDDLNSVFPGLEKAENLEPRELEKRSCWRISLPTAEGSQVYWVDQESYVVRRVEFSKEIAQRAFAWHNRLQILAARFEFQGAKFEADDDIKRYQMEVGDNALLVRKWLPRPPQPLAENLGDHVDEFAFADLDGNDISSESLADKIVVVDFWATWCKPCLDALPKLSKLREKYKDNPRVVFMAVSTDEPDVSNAKLRETFAANQIDLPIYRDTASYYRLVFGVSSLPTTVILDGQGIVQMSEAGADDAAIAVAIDATLSGVDVAAKKKREFREAVAEREKFLSEVLVGATAEDGSNRIATESKPARLKLTNLWKCDDLAQPRHILVAKSATASPRVYIHDGWNSIVELGLDGKVAETYELELPDDAPVSTSRTVVDKNGVRYFVAFATKQNQVHVFDNLWKHRFSYPDADFTHPGISNVLLADLDRDKTPEINISFWGTAGVQSLSFEGKRLWPRRLNKSLEDIQGLATTPPDADGKRQLIVAHYDAALATFSFGGQRGRDIVVPGHVLFDIRSAQFADNEHRYCALATGSAGQISALGIDEKGETAWSRRLPGVPHLAIDYVTTGVLPTGTSTKAKHWILLAPDSSLHFVDAEGNVLDQFNYGSELRAVAVVEYQGKSILLASTPTGVDAWQIDIDDGTSTTSPSE